MAWQFFGPDYEYEDDGEAIWSLKEFLVSLGWSVARSGSGSGGAFSNVGDVLDPGGPYTGLLTLASAWFELRQPADASPRRSFLFQKPTAGTTNGRWRIWYSSNGTGFTGGSPSATARGTAADEQGLINTPSGTTMWIQVEGTVGTLFGGYMTVIAGEVDEGYGFFFGLRRKNDEGFRTVLALDVIEQANSLDADPAVLLTNFPADGLFGTATSGIVATAVSQISGCSRGWYKKGLSGTSFVIYPPLVQAAENGVANTVEPLHQSQNIQRRFATAPECWYWRGSSTFGGTRGSKGRSRLFRTGIEALGGLRPNNLLDRINTHYLIIPWDGETLPRY